MCISVIGSLVSMLAPEGDGGGLGKNYRLILGLCVVLVCINPIKRVVLGIKNLEIDSIVGTVDENQGKYEEYLNSAYTDAEVESLKGGIYQMLEDKFNIMREECSVSVKLGEGEGNTRTLECIYITLYGGAIFKNTAEIEDCFGAIFNCEIITIIG